MELVGAMVANQGQKLEQISSHALDSCQSVYKSLENGAAQIDKVLNLQSQTVLNHLSKLEKTAEQVSDRSMPSAKVSEWKLTMSSPALTALRKVLVFRFAN